MTKITAPGQCRGKEYNFGMNEQAGKFMLLNNGAPLWAPKVPRSKVRRLYETDARGILDTDLIDEVGWALWERCDSILLATDAHYGHVHCPVCHVSMLKSDTQGRLRVAAGHVLEYPFRVQ